MKGLNKVILIGNLGKDPEIRHLENGVPVATFSLATTEVRINKAGEKISNTEWHNIVLWRGLADIAKDYLKKGHPVYIEGKLTNRSWDDKDGNKRYVTEVVGDNMILLSTRLDNNGNNDASHNAQVVATEPPVLSDTNDDLPF